MISRIDPSNHSQVSNIGCHNGGPPMEAMDHPGLWSATTLAGQFLQLRQAPAGSPPWTQGSRSPGEWWVVMVNELVNDGFMMAWCIVWEWWKMAVNNGEWFCNAYWPRIYCKLVRQPRVTVTSTIYQWVGEHLNTLTSSAPGPLEPQPRRAWFVGSESCSVRCLHVANTDPPRPVLVRRASLLYIDGIFSFGTSTFGLWASKVDFTSFGATKNIRSGNSWSVLTSHTMLPTALDTQTAFPQGQRELPTKNVAFIGRFYMRWSPLSPFFLWQRNLPEATNVQSVQVSPILYDYMHLYHPHLQLSHRCIEMP